MIQNPLKSDTITGFLLDIIDILLVLSVPVIVFFIILGGFKLVMAQGKDDKLKDAKASVLYAVVGGVLILAAKIIVELIKVTLQQFGVDV